MHDQLQLDREIQRDLYAILREKTAAELDDARKQRDTWEGKVELLEAKMDRIDELAIGATTPAVAKAKTGKGGRVPKGQSDKLIADFLKAANGAGATLEQITASTGTKTSSARRTINKLLTTRKIEKSGRGRWKWKAASTDIRDY